MTPDAAVREKAETAVEAGVSDRLAVYDALWVVADNAEGAADDWLPMVEPVPSLRRRLAILMPIAAASLAVHVGIFILLFLVIKEPTAIAEQQETPVEIVQEAEPPEPKTQEAKASPAAKPAEKAPEPEPPKVEPEKPKPDEAKQEPQKQETQKQEPQKQEAPKPEPPKPQQVAKVEPPAKPAAPDKAQEDAKALQALQQELASLKAEQQDLQAKAAEQSAPSKELGPLPESFRAVALPAVSPAGEDAVSYQEQVFSQLARAQKASKHRASPGVAHVVFKIDTQGNLIDVTLDHSSGDAFLDSEAVTIVRRASPFPAPPQGALRTFAASMKFTDAD